MCYPGSQPQGTFPRQHRCVEQWTSLGSPGRMHGKQQRHSSQKRAVHSCTQITLSPRLTSSLHTGARQSSGAHPLPLSSILFTKVPSTAHPRISPRTAYLAPAQLVTALEAHACLSQPAFSPTAGQLRRDALPLCAALFVLGQCVRSRWTRMPAAAQCSTRTGACG